MKKIMFNDRFCLTKVVLEGRKTQTRRIVSDFAIKKAREYQKEYYNATLETINLATALNQLYFVENRLKPPYDTEVVAIAQSYKDCGYYYNDDYLKKTAGWTNKMFVEANLMRHRIIIERTRIERLQDISEEDCFAEGVCFYENPPTVYDYDLYTPWPLDIKPYKRDIDNSVCFCTACAAYAYLIDKICGKGTWDKNPFVFVYNFKLID